MRKVSVILLLIFTGALLGQPVDPKKPPKPPTFTTEREFRPTAKDPAGGHPVFFFDYAKYKKRMGAVKQEFIQAKGLPPAPLSFDFGVGVDFPMLLNDQLGCCFYSSICHHDQLLTFHSIGTQSQFNLTTFRQRYLALSGGDNGLMDSDVQQEWKNRYLADVTQAKIIDWLYVDTTNPKVVGSAMYHFGGTQFTFAVPSAWINNSDTGDIWDASTYRPNNSGHAVYWAGVDERGYYKLVTWGTYVWITPAGVRVCDPSGFVVFSTRWFNKQGYAPNKLHITELAKIWQESGGKTIPASVISQFPPPGDVPPDPKPPVPPDPPLPPIPSDLPTLSINKPLPAGTYQLVPPGKIVVDPADLQSLKDAVEKLTGRKRVSEPAIPMPKSSGLAPDEIKRLLGDMQRIGDRLEKVDKRLDKPVDKPTDKPVQWTPKLPTHPYVAARTRSLTYGLPFVVFIGTPARDVPGCATAYASELLGQKTGILVAFPYADGNIRSKITLPAAATDREIRTAAELDNVSRIVSR